ncbi:hypothetical protein FGADI_12642 [Fusarium gaditjirri]|uniref:Uncharacterized protein n=1 Tax=Fusarium gaditjirri TaxID=282569 RepID=A0A8H4WNS2_9HYPO|nr:hypothetical protein FGADI_12642 [Fusarium gaditjirri]
MEILTKQYNKAISKIIPCLSDSSIHNIHCTLVCCLLFIAFESILGRYAESIHHLRAGNHLLTLPILAATEKNDRITRKIKDMLSTLSVEASGFTDDAILPDLQQSWDMDRAETTNECSSEPFQDLEQAASELCKLDVQFTALANARCCECSSDDSSSTVESGDEVDDSSSTLESESEVDDPDDRYMDTLFEDLRRRFKNWLARFEITKRALELQQSPHTATEQFLYLTLAQKFWSMNLYFVTEPVFDSTAEFLDAAENLAKTIANPDYFTFSLDGSLISGLSFVVRCSEEAENRKRALTLLRSLNRREGLWDSREIAEMHEITLSFDNFKFWYDKEYSGDIPSYLAKVVKELERIKRY